MNLTTIIAAVLALLAGFKTTITQLTAEVADLKNQLATDDSAKAELTTQLAARQAEIDALHAQSDSLGAALAQYADAPAADAPAAAAPAADAPAADAPAADAPAQGV